MINFFCKLILVITIIIFIYLWPKMFLEVPTSIKLAKLYSGNNSIVFTLPRGKGFEPWVAVKNCKNFRMKIKIYNENDKLIYQTNLNNKSRQLERLGDLMYDFKGKKYCKYLIVQKDSEKWKLFHYLNKYRIEIYSINVPKNTMLNLDYLKLWFPSITF